MLMDGKQINLCFSHSVLGHLMDMPYTLLICTIHKMDECPACISYFDKVIIYLICEFFFIRLRNLVHSRLNSATQQFHSRMVNKYSSDTVCICK